ncbi:hypothetical protein T5B8_11671 [Salinisphaera sp. T5B8]
MSMAAVADCVARLALVGVIVLLAACDARPDADALNPLEPGLRWQYRMVVQRNGAEPQRQTRIMENVARRGFAGEAAVAIRRNDEGRRYYLAERDDGYYRVAIKSVASHTPIMDQPAVKILPLPATLGAQWREPAHTYLLDRAQTFISEHAPGNTITLDYRITDVDAPVDVPAGRFEHCVLAVGRAYFKLGAGAGFAPTEVPIEQREWYCPGVGLARLERDERLTSQAHTITGGHISLELTHAPGR